MRGVCRNVDVQLSRSEADPGLQPPPASRHAASRCLGADSRAAHYTTSGHGTRFYADMNHKQLFAAPFEEKVDITAKSSCLLPRSCAAAAGGAGCFLAAPASCGPLPGLWTLWTPDNDTLQSTSHITCNRSHMEHNTRLGTGGHYRLLTSPCNCTAPICRSPSSLNTLITQSHCTTASPQHRDL